MTNEEAIQFAEDNYDYGWSVARAMRGIGGNVKYLGTCMWQRRDLHVVAEKSHGATFAEALFNAVNRMLIERSNDENGRPRTFEKASQ